MKPVARLQFVSGRWWCRTNKTLFDLWYEGDTPEAAFKNWLRNIVTRHC
jgi:hypothetical protein